MTVKFSWWQRTRSPHHAAFAWFIAARSVPTSNEWTAQRAHQTGAAIQALGWGTTTSLALAQQHVSLKTCHTTPLQHRSLRPGVKMALPHTAWVAKSYELPCAGQLRMLRAVHVTLHKATWKRALQTVIESTGPMSDKETHIRPVNAFSQTMPLLNSQRQIAKRPHARVPHIEPQELTHVEAALSVRGPVACRAQAWWCRAGRHCRSGVDFGQHVARLGGARPRRGTAELRHEKIHIAHPAASISCATRMRQVDETG